MMPEVQNETALINFSTFTCTPPSVLHAIFLQESQSDINTLYSSISETTSLRLNTV